MSFYRHYLSKSYVLIEFIFSCVTKIKITLLFIVSEFIIEYGADSGAVIVVTAQYTAIHTLVLQYISNCMFMSPRGIKKTEETCKFFLKSF